MRNNSYKGFVILSFIALVTACGSSGSKSGFKGKQVDGKDPIAEGYCLVFYKLDDFAKIYVDNKLVLDTSDDYGMAPSEEVLVNLNPFLTSGTHQLTVELYNGKCADCYRNNWSLFYELFNDAESLEFVAEDSNNISSGEGMKVTNTFKLDVTNN